MRTSMKRLFVYPALVLIFGGLLSGILHLGSVRFAVSSSDNSNPTKVEAVSNSLPTKTNLELLHENLKHPLARLLLQIVCIVIVARFMFFLFRKLGQPGVIGEILAGILLGPSVLGFLIPESTSFLFPKDSLGTLQLFSHIGLVMFMFIIGMELDLTKIKNAARSAILISHSSILLAFLLGTTLSIYLYPRSGSENAGFIPFALFMGISMSITAFPVLARIVQERGLINTPLGSLAITCAAVDDVTAWTILAVVVAVIQSSALEFTYLTISLTVLFIIVMMFVIRPILEKASQIYVARETLTPAIVTALLTLLFISALFTETIGIHALLGAFLAGVIMPGQTKFRRLLSEKLEDFSVIFLMPLFFALTGLRTEISTLDEPGAIITTLIIILVAIIGKFGGSAIAAKLSGHSTKDSLSLGSLMNTRGLMELIVLNIGYDLGILSSQIFTMMVFMALITTFMAGPALALIQKLYPNIEPIKKRQTTEFRVLLPFGPIEGGIALLKLSHGLGAHGSTKNRVTALHLQPSTGYKINPIENAEVRGIFEPLQAIATERNIQLDTELHISDDIAKDIKEVALEIDPSLIVMGAARTLFGESITGGKVGDVLKSVDCSVGIFINNGFTELRKALLIYSGERDRFLLDLASYAAKNSGLRVNLYDQTNSRSLDQPINRRYFAAMKGRQKPRIEREKPLTPQYLRKFDVVITSIETWLEAKERESLWLEDCPASVLLIRPKQNS